MTTDLPTEKRLALIVPVLAMLCFLMGLMLSFVVVNRQWVFDLFVSSYEARYRAMSETESRSDHWYVFHEDTSSLQTLVNSDPEILAFKPSGLSGLAIVETLPNSPRSVERIRGLEEISLILDARLPFICR